MSLSFHGDAWLFLTGVKFWQQTSANAGLWRRLGPDTDDPWTEAGLVVHGEVQQYREPGWR